MKKIALIPAYQPTPLLLELLREVRHNGFDIILVDDGSSKDKASLFSKAAEYATVLHHPENKGKGSALKTGLCYILEHFLPDYVVVTMDADGQHKAADAAKICCIAQEQPKHLILGSRELKEHVPLRSRIGNAVTRFVYRISTGVKVHDTQTGLRAFSSFLIPAFIKIPGERYEYEMNVLLSCPRKNIPIQEVAIETLYFNNNAASHFNTLKESYRIYKEILKFSASSFISFLIDYGLYSLLTVIIGKAGSSYSLILSNIGARLVSASVNYTLNKKLVFHSNAIIWKSILQYCLLAITILIGNTLLLSLLADVFGINQYIAKLCTEIIFFAVNWLVQKLFIFQKTGGD